MSVTITIVSPAPELRAVVTERPGWLRSILGRRPASGMHRQRAAYALRVWRTVRGVRWFSWEWRWQLDNSRVGWAMSHRLTKAAEDADAGRAYALRMAWVRNRDAETGH